MITQPTSKITCKCGQVYTIKTPYLIYPGSSGTIKHCVLCKAGELGAVYWENQPHEWASRTPSYTNNIVYRWEFQIDPVEEGQEGR